MSATDVERPVSPASTDSDSGDENMIGLKDIKTIGQMYKEGLLKAASKARVKRAPKPELLEKISLLYAKS